MTEAVIFDMDGVLIDSEPLWRKAEIKFFSKVGIHLTEELCLETLGLRTDELVQYWHKKHPWENLSLQEVAAGIEQTVKELILSEGRPMSGYLEAIRFFRQQGFKTGLASSSTMELITTVLTKLEITGMFDVVHSAEHEKYGKPHPDVYLSTAAKLGVKPENCLAIEDSLNGLKSAKAAGMKTIAMPAPENRGNPQFGMADRIIGSLKDIQHQLITEL